MKRISLFLALVLLAASGAWSQPAAPLSAAEIMKKVRSHDGISSTQTRVRMQLVDKGGSTSERLIDQFSVEEKGLTKMAIIFQAPASVKDTRFLTVQNASGSDDRWIFLPALAKVRRVASGEGNSSFMGTDFTYDDLSSLSSRPMDRDDYALLGTDTVNGEKVFIVEVKPKNPADSAYPKTVQTILADKWLAVKIDIYDKDGKVAKVNEVSEYKQVDGFWTPIKSSMKNLQTGHSTNLSVEKLILNKPIPAGVFTTKFLETGRP